MRGFRKEKIVLPSGRVAGIRDALNYQKEVNQVTKGGSIRGTKNKEGGGEGNRQTIRNISQLREKRKKRQTPSLKGGSLRRGGNDVYRKGSGVQSPCGGP